MESRGIDELLGRINQGDCLDILSRLPAGFADLVFADPPFNIGYDYDVYQDRRGPKEYLEWSKNWIQGVYRILKPDGTFWLAIGDEFAAELKVLAQEIGFTCRSWVVWYYTFGVNCTHKFSRSHAHMFYFVKNPKNFTFRDDELENRIPSARQLVYADSRANPRGRLPDDTWILRPQDLVDSFSPLEDTWYFPRVAGTFTERAGFHGCQMPEQLLGRIIRFCSEEGEIIVDPFSGSATTLAVAKKLGRRSLGMELSEEYVERGQARLDGVREGDPLEGSKEPTVSAPATSGKQSKGGGGKQFKDVRPSALDAKLNKEIEKGLIEAFERSHDGFSPDRLVADPELNQRFAEHCRKLGLIGDVVLWNLSLFRLRKAGRLAHIPTGHRTVRSWQDCDSYLFASEIALRRMKETYQSLTLDSILCDPEMASKFDEIAAKFAPGFTPLDYRWGALKLRKEAKTSRHRGLAHDEKWTSRDLIKIPLGDWDSDEIPETPGIYMIKGEEPQDLYGGETLNLRKRLKTKFGDGRKSTWEKDWLACEIEFYRASTPDPKELLGLQTRLVNDHQPRLNYLDFAVA